MSSETGGAHTRWHGIRHESHQRDPESGERDRAGEPGVTKLWVSTPTDRVWVESGTFGVGVLIGTRRGLGAAARGTEVCNRGASKTCYVTLCYGRGVPSPCGSLNNVRGTEDLFPRRGAPLYFL